MMVPFVASRVYTDLQIIELIYYMDAFIVTGCR